MNKKLCSIRLKAWTITLYSNSPLTSTNWEHGEEHKAKNWSKWRRFSWQIVCLTSRESDVAAFRLWVYTRTKAYDFDLYFDKRKPELPPEHFNCRSTISESLDEVGKQ